VQDYRTASASSWRERHARDLQLGPDTILENFQDHRIATGQSLNTPIECRETHESSFENDRWYPKTVPPRIRGQLGCGIAFG
jgi:hypothetical protein